jgi:hypothetical protein
MLAGPSAVRENLIYDRFNKAFPGKQTFQEALSLGTIDDLIISLEYIEKVYSKDVLPKILVLGVTPRFVANIPEERPFMDGINRYSPYYYIERISGNWHLVRKNRWKGTLSRTRFLLLKQQARYRTAVASAIGLLIDADLINGEDQRGMIAMHSLQRLLEGKVIKRIKRFIDFATSPYKYRNNKPLTHEILMEWLQDPESWWKDVHSWNPEETKAETVEKFEELRKFNSRNGISMYVINLSENILGRQLYKSENYKNYIALMEMSLQGAPFLNLREFLETSEFHDVVHARLPGAIRITDRVIEFISAYDDPHLVKN